MVARVPFFLFWGISATILPAVSQALGAGAMGKVRSAIQQAVRFLFLLTIPIGVLVSIYSRDIMVLLFPLDYAAGAKILAVLIWGMTFLSFVSLLTTIINADNRPQLSFKITIFTVILDVILNRFFVPHFGAIGGAISTTVAVGAGAVIAMIFVYRRFLVFVEPRSLLRVSGTVITVGLISILFKVDGHYFLIPFSLSFVLYGLGLFIIGEVKIKEISGLFKNRGSEETITSAQSDSLPL